MQKKLGFFSFGIRQKIGLVLISVLLLSLGANRWYSLQQQKTLIIEETQVRGNDLAKFTSQSIAYAVVGYDYHGIQLLLNQLISSQDINYAKVINTKGNIMAKAGRLSIDNDAWTYFEQEITLDGNTIGALSIQFDNSRIIEKLSLQHDEIIQQEIFLILLIAIGEYLALSFFLVRPIVCSSEHIRKSIENGSLLIEKIPYKANDELGYLFSHFHDLQSRLHDMAGKLESKIQLANNEVKTQNILLKSQTNQLHETNKKLRQLSISDPLTELFNRRHFDILLKKEISYAQRHHEKVSLIVFDIDYFKKINDQYGHSVGDAVLCSIAKNLEDNTRKSDICCRIGGEEFAIICRDTDAQKIKIITEGLRKKFETKTIRNNQHEINITASFGTVTFPRSSGGTVASSDIYNHADTAMYYSKRNGRNRITHYNDISAPYLNTGEPS